MSILLKLDSFRSALGSEPKIRAGGKLKDSKVLKHYFLCEAFTLAHELIVRYSHEKLNKSDVIRRSIKSLYKLAEAHGVVERGTVNPLQTKKMYYIPLYDDGGNLSEDLHIDAIPVNESEDSRLKPTKNSRCEISSKENEMLIALKTIYKLQSDADMILHSVMVYASMLSVEVEERLHVYKELRRGMAPVVPIQTMSPSIA